MSYNVRDSSGTLKIALSNSIALQVMDCVPGNFKEVNYASAGGKVRIFEISADRKVEFPIFGGRMTLYFWSGDRLIPVKE